MRADDRQTGKIIGFMYAGILVLILAACGPVGAAGPTLAPVDTPFVAYTPQVDPTSSTPEALIITPPPQGQSSPAPTAEGTVLVQPTSTQRVVETAPLLELPDIPIPDAAIKIFRPGRLSRVISPFRVAINAEPGLNDQVWIELKGEDGRLLARRIMKLQTMPGFSRADLSIDLEFEVEGVAEAGRLEVSTQDEYGRPQYLSSVDLILLSTGLTRLNSYDLQEKIVLEQPVDFDEIEGGSLIVSGIARGPKDKPVLVEILDSSGKVISQGKFEIIVLPDEDFGLFGGELVYKVDVPIWARLVLRLQGARIPGIEHMYSIELYLSP